MANSWGLRWSQIDFNTCLYEMNFKVRWSPRLLKKHLVQSVSSETPKRSGNAPKRHMQLTNDEHSCDTPTKRRKKEDFIDSAIRAVSSDEDLSGFLNLAVCQGEGDSENFLVVVTTKMLYYHEPAKHMSRLRLVLSCLFRLWPSICVFLCLQQYWFQKGIFKTIFQQ